MRSTPDLRIHCICADWCDTCTAFRPVFDTSAIIEKSNAYAWHILEDLEERFQDIDVETFPTVLITDTEGGVLFIGPILPNAQALRQIVDSSKARIPLVQSELAARWLPVAKALADH